METRVPLQIASSKVKNGTLPLSQQGISLSRKGIAVSAFGPNPDGDGTILRLWEQAGISGQCTVKLPQGLEVASIQPIDLRGGTIGSPLDVVNGEFTFDIKGYAPSTFLFEFYLIIQDVNKKLQSH